MVFISEDFKVIEGLLSKTYTIVDETKACEIAVQKELIEAIRELTRRIQ